MKLETVKFVSIWDVDGSDVLRDLDFGLTYGEGLTLHSVRDVIDELRYEASAHKLVGQLSRFAHKFGDDVLIGF